MCNPGICKGLTHAQVRFNTPLLAGLKELALGPFVF